MISTSSQIIDDEENLCFSSPNPVKTQVEDPKVNSHSIDPSSWVNQEKVSRFDDQFQMYSLMS